MLTLAATAALSTACASGQTGETGPSATVGTVSDASPSSLPTKPSERPEIHPEPVAAPVGIYTEDQAERGRAVFRSVCSECHYSSEFRGAQFQFEWRRRTVWNFYREISRTMPEDAPGSLDPQQYVDIISYVLRSNGFEPGDAELTPDEAVMDAHSMASPS